MAARDDFLSMASHELKTPLSALLLVIDSLRRGEPGDTVASEWVMRRLEMARRQVMRLDQLVTRLLDVSRIRAGRLDLTLADDDLAGAVRDVVERLRSPHAPPIQLGGDVRVPCRFDRLRVDQVVTNLISNASKYGEQKAIEVEVSARGAEARLMVRDHGPGIPEEQRVKLFERFERAGETRHVGGFGLGLWIARAIVHAHGGQIAVEDTPGGGATLVVVLPRRGPRRGAEETALAAGD